MNEYEITMSTVEKFRIKPMKIQHNSPSEWKLPDCVDQHPTEQQP